jgi:DnaA family protein
MKNLNSQKDQQIPLILNKLPKNQLKSGIIGYNHETLEAVKKFLLSEYIQSKSFIVWGNQGSGKSFWLQAWANEISNSKYFNLKNDILTETTRKNILILDNLEYASNVNQTFIFRLFSLPENSNIKILGSTSSVFELSNKSDFRQDLCTRLKQGLIYKLRPLTDIEKKDALKDFIYSVGWLSSKEDCKYDALLEYMLQRFPRQLPTLKHILINSHQLALSNKCPVTIPLIKSIMEKMTNE